MMHYLRLSRGSRRVALAATCLLWLAAVCVGIVMLTAYSNVPGPVSRDSASWPTSERLELNPAGSTLVLFAHPHCPCTRATLGELEKIAAVNDGKLQTWVVFIKPTEVGDDWEDSDLRRSALSIPGVHVVDDVDGVEARRFGATTSGQTMFYSERGERLFSGGITVARGHAGDNAGRTAIEMLLKGEPPGYSQTPVFGCPLESLRVER